MLKVTKQGSNESSILLDSSLIVATSLKTYDLKLVDCGEYTQVYLYENSKTKKEKDDELKLTKLKKCSEEKTKDNNLKVIEKKNIIRSKLECQRLAKTNMCEWKTFITLTFKENVTDITQANKRYHAFITKVQRVKKDFKYICIPEFQKRGAVHYHLLTNIDIDDKSLIYVQEDNLKFKHIKYWNDGFTSVEQMKGDTKKIVGYISKYMTKDIDNRLFNRHRYFYSKNLRKPQTSYIDLNELKHKEFYIKKLQEKDLIFEREYINPYNNESVQFLEYLTQSNYTKADTDFQEKGV